MRKHTTLETRLTQAEQHSACAIGHTRAEKTSLIARAQHNELIQPFPHCFSRPAYWQSLSPAQQTLHICRALYATNPSIIFAGSTAATIHGLSVSYRLHNGIITCASTRKTWNNKQLHHLYTHCDDAEIIHELPVTSCIQTVVDCALILDFEEVLPMFDDYVRKGLSPSAIINRCARLRRDTSRVLFALHHANANSENGGESWARAVMITLGFMIPELQVQFYDKTTSKWYRVDFLWRLPNGTIIVGEFDGMAKYSDPKMIGTQTVEQRVLAERERDAALLRCGVTQIAHFSYQDVLQRIPLMRKLEHAGVPRVR